MRIVLFCEGWTEVGGLPAFLNRWINSQLPPGRSVGIKPVRFEGWPQLVRDIATKVPLHLGQPDTIAVFALLDLYGPTFFPNNINQVADKCKWGTDFLHRKHQDRRFHVHFAVHEVEAWILAQSEVLPREIRDLLPNGLRAPEAINGTEPPGQLLDRLYRQAGKGRYKKRTHGAGFFKKMDAEQVRQSCPAFKRFTDDLLCAAIA